MRTTYGWLCIPEQAPVDLGKPFVLLNLAGTGLAAQSCLFLLVQ